MILAGVRSVGLFDPEIAQIEDLGSQFYLTPSDVGSKTRARASFQKLSTLNQYVNTHLVEANELSENLIAQYKVVVMSDRPLAEQLAVNAWCRAHEVKFVSGSTLGFLSSFFVDLGEEHVISDPDGSENLRGLISHVSNDVQGVVTCSDEQRHGLSDGDYVTFEEVEGMTELNSLPPQKVRVRSPYSFTIGDTTKFSPYTGTRGFFNQEKMPVTLSFKPLAEALKAPEFSNDILFDSAQHQVLYEELQAFRAAHGRFPRPDAISEASAVVDAVAKRVAGGENPLEFSADMRQNFFRLARAASTSLAPVTAFAGGVLGQEVLKAASGKFTPIHQFLHWSSVQSSPDVSEETPEGAFADFSIKGCRYDHYIAAYGSSIHAKIAAQNLFLVGAGAIGCEMLKNWALMGVATAPGSRVTVTDMDTIEKSNLNRQFLFRPADVGKLKSQAAAAAAMAMNTEMTVVSHALKVGPETENVYNDAFWQSLSGVYTALDNVEARLFVDSKCVYYRKPMVDSGTLGTKGNTQVVVPGLTESYGSTRDPPESGIPVCTLKNFPFKIEHTIQWARDYFEGIFKQAAEEAQNYITKPHYLEDLAQQPNTQLTCLQTLKATLVDRPSTLADCVRWARHVFDEEFDLNIRQLVHNFPADQLTAQGTPFWSGTKRCPVPLTFDPNDPTHMAFVISAAALHAFNYGIPGEVTEDLVREALKDYKAPVFTPKQIKIATTDSEAREQQDEESVVENHDEVVRKLVASLPPPQTLTNLDLHPVEFEKDDDSNHHIDFITACSNLRARCYRIKESSKHETKFVAGKIIPAIATTTALVTGLVCTEMVKILQNKPLEAYRSTFVNLAIVMMTDSEPFPPEYTKTKLPDGTIYKWSLWDAVDVDGTKGPNGGEITLRQFKEFAEKKFNAAVQMINYGPVMLYVSYVPKKSADRMDLPLSEAIERVTKEPLSPYVSTITLDCILEDDEGEDLSVPEFRVKIRDPETIQK